MTQRTTSKATLPQIKPAAIRAFQQKLHAWYEAHGRHELPWRNTRDPYAIWLSEVMLQQTQVSTVLERFYHPFLKKFPTVKSLADAPREAVMKAWEGLGYYRRAGYLHEAAKVITTASLRAHSDPKPSAERHSQRIQPGQVDEDELSRRSKAVRDDVDRIAFPDTVEALLTLPGIGRNTAHAVAAFAYHQPVAIMEANVKRIVARIFTLAAPSDTQLWEAAATLLDRDEPFHHNQAMMDLGALICLPKNPLCLICPANRICLGKVNPQDYPAPKIKKPKPVREVIILVREDAVGKLFLEPRDTALLGGLYGFPQLTTPAKKDWVLLGVVSHAYSHFKIIGRVMRESVGAPGNSANWHTSEEIAALPLSKVDHKALALVKNCHSSEKKKIKAAKPHHAD